MSFAQPSGDGMYFDGVDDNLTVPNTTNINSTTTNNRTYETYFKVTSTTARQVIMKEGGGTRAVILYVQNGYIVLGAYNRADYTPNWQGTFYRKAISANTWYHIALVFDNAQPGNNPANPMNATANNALKFYMDGVLEADNSGYQLGGHNSIRLGYKNENLRFPNCGTWTAASGSAEYCFGTIVNDNMNGTPNGEYYFEGNIFGFRVWNDVRTLAEITDNMDNIITTVGTDDLVAALDGDTLTYLDSSDNPQDVNNANGPTAIIWSATAATTDWNTGSNWVGSSAPNAAIQEPAIIQVSSNYPVITSHIKTGDLEVQAGAEITIQAGGTLDVTYDMSNNGTVTVENNGSLITRETKALTGSGTYIVERDTPSYGNPDFFSIWSTPVAEADSEIGTIFPEAILAFEYDASQDPSAYVGVSGSDDMEVGKGYFVRSIDNNAGVLTRTFAGTVNNSDIDETIYFNSTTDNFNLIGNPYPSAIDWLTFHADNSDVLNGTMYFWSQTVTGVNNSASDYISFNSTGSNIPGTTGNIASGQGIFTKSSQAGTVTFKNTHRVVGNNAQFFRSSNNPDEGKSWFKLSGDNGFSSILIGFIPGATDGYESQYDGEFVNEGSAIEFYSFIDEDKYAIQGKPELEENVNEEIPLGFEVTTAGTYTISIFQEYIDPNFDIILDDTLENTQTDLRQSDYTFNLTSPIEGNDRFILRYNYTQTLGVVDFSNDTNEIKTFFDNNTLVSLVSQSIIPISIEVFDTVGKNIKNSEYKEKLNINGLSSGVYLVKYNFSETNSLTKKVLKK